MPVNRLAVQLNFGIRISAHRIVHALVFCCHPLTGGNPAYLWSELAFRTTIKISRRGGPPIFVPLNFLLT